MIGIYITENKVNQKCYIGQSTDVKDRIAHHKSYLSSNSHTNQELQNDWNKYGKENFEFKILCTCNNEELDEKEKYYISLLKTNTEEHGYNLDTGGHKGRRYVNKTLERMSKAKEGMYIGENNPMYGVHLKHTEEWKAWASERFSGHGNPMYGVHLKISDEQKKKKSEMFKGENNPFYGKKHSDETRKKMSNSKKKISVMCVETGVVYPSCNAAQRETGIHSGSIARAYKNGLTAGGYHWKQVV